MLRRTGKNSHWHVGPDLEKVELFGSFVGNSRGRIQVRTEAHHVLRFNHWKSGARAKTQAERLMKPLKSNENTSSITESKAFFSGAFALSVFSVLGSFCWLYKWTCYRAPLLTSLWRKRQEHKSADALSCTSRCQSVAELNIFWLNPPRDPTEAGQRKYQQSLCNRTMSYSIAEENLLLQDRLFYW